MLKKLFGFKSISIPQEPIFPKEKFSIFKLNLEDGLAFATINTGYNNYSNKSFFPWCVQKDIDILDKNDNGYPVDTEAELLNEIENKITHFLKETG